VSYRDLEQMMRERGVSADHSTIYRWVQKYAPEIEQRLRWQWRGHCRVNFLSDGRKMPADALCRSRNRAERMSPAVRC
jgi:hypothetical protein